MTIKKIEDMDHYEILNIKRSASQQEIENAYLVGKAAYNEDSLAHYTLLNDEERQRMLDLIEAAFSVLGYPERRQAYDEQRVARGTVYQEKAYFRQSTEKMLIEDIDNHDDANFLKRFFSPSKKRVD
jgi:DnaJ-class molecular chaperone